MKRRPTGIPLLLGFILIVVAINTTVYCDEHKFCDEWGIVGFGSIYMKSSTLKITENDITWPGCQSVPYKIISAEDNAWKFLVPKFNCHGIQKDSGGGYILTLISEDQDELKIKVYDARGNTAEAKEIAWGEFYRIPFDKKRNFFGQIADYPISMHLEVSKKGNVEGHYSYDKYKEQIPLRGTIKGGKILLNIYGQTRAILETFDGKYKDDKISGTWKHKNRFLKFHLVREPWEDHYISCEEMKKYPERVFGERSIDLGTGSGSPNEVDYDCEGGLATLKFMKKLYHLTEVIRGDGSADCAGTIVHAHWRYYRYTMLKLGLAPGEGGGIDPNTLHYFRLWAHQSLSKF